MRGYQPRPVYPPVGGGVAEGWDAPVATLPAGPCILAVDGPEMADWAKIREGVEAALRAAGREVATRDAHAWLRPWPEIEARTASPLLDDDPDFATLTDADMADVVTVPALDRPADGVLLVHGPGAALADHDVLWFADLPKRFAEAATNQGRGRNLGMPANEGPGTTRRLFYTDWPIQDRHRDAVGPRVDRWLDAQDPANPGSIDGDTLRATLASLSGRPFRVMPTFLTVSWGGHWAQRVLGMNPEARNTGIGYDLIAPESSVLIGGDGDRPVEVPFQLVVAMDPERVMGPDVHAVFGRSFPIRFDYLDTIDGGNLSVHCHPMADYMRRTFGWPYTQHENYYVMVNSPDSRVFLGLHEGVDLEEFQERAHTAVEHGREFDVLEFVQSHPATLHQLFAVPGGTPHGSGVGNVVLEVSATPYLYSLRFYDWLRRDANGVLRPVHVEHAFANLQRDHVGPAVVDDLIRPARPLREGDGWREEDLTSLPEVFFEVRRLTLDPGVTAPDDTAGRFHILNVVEGPGVVVETERGDVHEVAYAETIVIPAAVGPYRLRSEADVPVLVVKAQVR